MLLGAGNTSAGKLVIGGIELDDKSKTVTVDGEAANLTHYRVRYFEASHGASGRGVFAESDIMQRSGRMSRMGQKTRWRYIFVISEKG